MQSPKTGSVKPATKLKTLVFQQGFSMCSINGMQSAFQCFGFFYPLVSLTQTGQTLYRTNTTVQPTWVILALPFSFAFTTQA